MANELIAQVQQTEVDYGRLRFWWLGQQSWIVKTATSTLYIDPYLTPLEKRNTKPFFTPQELINADYIFGTHDHSDHIDHPSLPGMLGASPQARLIVPQVAYYKLTAEGIDGTRLVTLGRQMSYNDGKISVTALKAKHEFFDYSDEYGFPHLQYIIELDGVTIYAAGDTLCYDGMLPALAQWNLTLALVPINGRDGPRYRRGCMGNMTWQEAADLSGELRPALACPAHYEMFSGNSEDPAKFADYLDIKYPQQKYWIGKPGTGMLVTA